MLAPLLSIAAGLVLLVAGASALVRGAASLALRFGVSPLIVGLTVVAFGTSAPELVVSVGAALDGAGGIAIGNVVGSNIANIGLILGVAALVRPIPIESGLLRRDVPLMLLATLAASALLLDGALGALGGAALVAALLAYVGWNVYLSRVSPDQVAAEELPPMTGAAWVDPLWILGGLAGLVLGADLLVGGAVVIATTLGVSNAVVGLTVVGVGTSLPELATSLVATVRGQSAIAAGNVVGSNLFNLLGILGAAAVVAPLSAPGLTIVDVAVMMGSALAMTLFMWTARRVGRAEGGLLLAGYVAYVAFLVSTV
jgi:cation:H+ antiporter